MNSDRQIVKICQKMLDRDQLDRMNKIRGNVAERLQNEATDMHSGMRDSQPGMVDDPVFIKNDIHIQNPGTKTDGRACPAGTSLNPFQAVKELKRVEPGGYPNDLIDKPVLIQIIDRIGAIDSGCLNQVCVIGIDQTVNTILTIQTFVTQVGTNANIRITGRYHIITDAAHSSIVVQRTAFILQLHPSLNLQSSAFSL